MTSIRIDRLSAMAFSPSFACFAVIGTNPRVRSASQKLAHIRGILDDENFLHEIPFNAGGTPYTYFSPIFFKFPTMTVISFSG
jgi:hypothetical protein